MKVWCVLYDGHMQLEYDQLKHVCSTSELAEEYAYELRRNTMQAWRVEEWKVEEPK